MHISDSLAPRFSVLVPVRDGAATLARALRSALAQTEPPFEILVIDDGSTDESGAIAEAFAPQGVRLLRLPHGGVAAARNAGAAAARGDWLALLDADDEWLPEKLAEVRAALRPETDCLFHAYFLGSGTEAARYAPEGPVADYAALLLANRLRPPATTAACIRRAAWLAAGGCPEGRQWGEDQALWLALAARGRLQYLDRPLARYHVGTPGSLSKSLSDADAEALAADYAAFRSDAVGRRLARASRIASILQRADRRPASASLRELFAHPPAWGAYRLWAAALAATLVPGLLAARRRSHAVRGADADHGEAAAGCGGGSARREEAAAAWSEASGASGGAGAHAVCPAGVDQGEEGAGGCEDGGRERRAT